MEYKIFKNNKFLTASLVILFICNALVVSLDIIPFLKSRFERKEIISFSTINSTKIPEKIIIEKSLEMAKSNEVTMVWKEQKSFSEELVHLTSDRSSSAFEKYNYPRAYLLSGLTEYAKSRKDTLLMLQTAEILDEYIDSQGLPKFNFDKVDQVPFGIAAINIFDYTKNNRYKKFADFIYQYLVEQQTKDTKLILYKKNSKVQFIDALGMICPFLLRYETSNPKNNKVGSLIKNQLKYYIKYGIDKTTFLPTHGINLASNIKVGPTNWGRGIGWYLMALSEYTKKNQGFGFELQGLINTIEKLKTKESTWTQFPGHSEQFDASSTTMFMYAINVAHPNTFSKNEIWKILGKYISDEGVIRLTSGDTYGINNYSQTFGDSEFSQGILLMLMATTQK